MKSKIFYLFLITFISAATVAETYNIGAVLILTSDQAVYGQAMQEGIGLAESDCNQQLTKQDAKVKVFYEDSALQPKQANTAAMKLVNQNQVVAILNSAYSEVMGNGKMLQSKGIPTITLWDSSREIESLGDYIFGIGLWTPSAAEVSANFAFNNLKAKTSAIIYTEAEWASIVSELFKENFQKSGGKILGEYPINHDNNDFKAILTKIRFNQPDVIYAPLMQDILPFYKQLKQFQISSKVVTSDIIAKEHIDQAPELFEGVYQSGAPKLSDKRLIQKYQTTFKQEPKLPLITALGYDGLMLICEAIKANQTSPDLIKDFLSELKDYPGLSNQITFTDEGSSPLNEVIYQIRNGKLLLVD